MFSPDDIASQENTKMLTLVVMTKIGKPPLTNFHKLLIKDKKIFNTTLNEYIKSFPDENWKETLTSDFNNACCDEIFNENFSPKNYEPIQINSEIELLQ